MKDKERFIRDLSKRLKNIRQRPISDKEIDEFNQIIDSDGKSKQKPGRSNKKVAFPPESSL